MEFASDCQRWPDEKLKPITVGELTNLAWIATLARIAATSWQRGGDYGHDLGRIADYVGLH